MLLGSDFSLIKIQNQNLLKGRGFLTHYYGNEILIIGGAKQQIIRYNPSSNILSETGISL